MVFPLPVFHTGWTEDHVNLTRNWVGSKLGCRIRKTQTASCSSSSLGMSLMEYVLSIFPVGLLSPGDLQECRFAFQRFSTKFFRFLHNDTSNMVNVFRDRPVGFCNKAKHQAVAADFSLSSRKYGPANQTFTVEFSSGT